VRHRDRQEVVGNVNWFKEFNGIFRTVREGTHEKVPNIWKFEIIFVHFTIMTSITLLHPEETFIIPALQSTNTCSLFQKDLAPVVLLIGFNLLVLSAFSRSLSPHWKGM
jgi:hypothetical protein